MDGTEAKTNQQSCCRHQKLINFLLWFFIILLGCAFTFSMIHSSQKFAELQDQITFLKQVRLIQKNRWMLSWTLLRWSLFCSLTAIKRLIFVPFYTGCKGKQWHDFFTNVWHQKREKRGSIIRYCRYKITDTGTTRTSRTERCSRSTGM